MIHHTNKIVITSVETISPSTRASSQISDLKDFFDLNNHYICNVNSTDSKSRDSRIMGKHTLMLMKSADSSYRQSRLNEYKPEDIGLFMSLGMFDYEIDDLLPAVIKSIKNGQLDYPEFFKKGFREIYPLWPLTMLNNIAMCQCAIRLGIKGDNAVFSPHSDSSLNAIYEGWMSIAEKHSEASIVGGVSEIISPMSLVRYILCNTNASRINDTNRIPPYKVSEGAVALTLETIDNAVKRGLPCLCVLKGFGAGFGVDEKKGGATVDAIETSMRLALLMADIRPQDIDILFSHHNVEIEEGVNEYKALNNTFSQLPVIINTKSRFGDMLSSAGVYDVALGIKILSEPAHTQTIANKKINHPPAFIMINAMSVEGNVTTLIIGKE